jgi:CRISPR system Cascade subunit CasD
MTSLIIPRRVLNRWSGKENDLSARRLEDFHTVLDTRRASGKMNRDAVITHRQYLLDARFGVILSGEGALLAQAADALQNPVWGIWFGRKSCLPASPVFRMLAASEEEAIAALTEGRPVTAFTRMSEAANFTAGTDTLADLPISFGERRFAVRRVNLEMAERTADNAAV